ncbi:MAG: hypothetical protein V1678_03155 [Candidatus Aenigmatarchaeota archaeon]
MKPQTKPVDFEREVFNIKNKPMRKGDWWYWLWLFFFNNPKNPENPRQLMILWSSKNEKEIDCNTLKLNMNSPKKEGLLNGAVASWYFDGKRMHHNFLLEKCDIKFLDNLIKTESTSFFVGKNSSRIKIGKDFDFVVRPSSSHEFLKPTQETVSYPMSGYSMIESKRLKLTGKVSKENISGSAYFQQFLFHGIYPSWYWGVLHFENGASLIYMYSFLLRKRLKSPIDYITFFDGKNVHSFDNARVKMIGGTNPEFRVHGESESELINFSVKAYSQTAWRFRKKSLGIIPNTLTYNEYPSVVSSFTLKDKASGKSIVLKDLGKSVGNSEYGEGFLL